MSEEKNLPKQGSPTGLTRLPSVGIKFLVVALLLVLVKLWIVSSDEIIARYTPHDDLWYIDSAKNWYWFGSNSDGPFRTPHFIRLPAYPLFIALTKLTGLPLRISIELLLLFAALVFVIAIIKAGHSRLWAIVLFAAIIFHPAGFLVNSHATTDSLYAPVLLFSLASMIILLLKRNDAYRFRYALLVGTTLAILWHVRQESILIWAILGAFGLILLMTTGVRRKTLSVDLRQLGVLVLVPAIVVLVVSLTIKTVNYLKFGLFASDAMSASGFESAGKALLRIKPMPPMRFVVVPREVRQRAYQVSPAFRELEAYMEGDPGRIWVGFSRDAGVQADGEISTGHFWWALHRAAYESGYTKSVRELDLFFRRVANEINAGCDDGRLQCRWAFSSVLDPHFQNYLPHLAGSFRRISSMFVENYGPAREQDPPGSSLETRQIFDEMANRRTTLNTPDSMTYLSGWALNPTDTLQRVVVRSKSGRTLTSTDQLTPRPDVALVYSAKHIEVPVNSGYHLKFPSDEAQGAGVDLVFITQSGKELVVPRTTNLKGGGNLGSLTYAVDVDETFTKSYELQSSVQRFIGSIHARLIVVLTYLGLGALVVLLLSYKFINPRDTVYAILALLVAAVLIRVCFFTLIDASSYTANQTRYIFPVLPIYTCLLLMLIGQALSVIRARLHHHGLLQKLQFRIRNKKPTSAESV